MKQTFTKLKTVFVATLLLASSSVYAQDVEDLIKSNPADASKLIGAYLNPLFKGLGSGLNSGWSHTAKSKGTLRFELRISAAGALVPTDDRTYDVNTLGLTSIRPTTPGASTGPTAFGADRSGSSMTYTTQAGSVNFNLPEGLGFHIVPTPQIQATVGLPKNIDVMLRYVPNIKISDDGGKVGMFGVGAKVELLPLFMGKTDKLVPLDLALEMGYSKVDFTLPINSGGGSNQRIEAKFNGFHTDVIISKKLLFFTPFASVGYQSSNSNLAALGTYTFDTPTGTQSITNPINIDPKGLGGMRASVGFQLKLAIFKLYGSYTAAEYNTVNAGIAFGIGN